MRSQCPLTREPYAHRHERTWCQAEPDPGVFQVDHAAPGTTVTELLGLSGAAHQTGSPSTWWSLSTQLSFARAGQLSRRLPGAGETGARRTTRFRRRGRCGGTWRGRPDCRRWPLP